MYVHGAPLVRNLFFFFRIGQDSANFYEYHTELQPDWSLLNDVKIVFDSITGLKERYIRSSGETNPFINFEKAIIGFTAAPD